MTVTLGPFFFSSATEGPGSSRKKTEPATRAAANSTFMLRSDRRSIHRQERARPGQPAPEGGGAAAVWTPAPPSRGAGRGVPAPPPGLLAGGGRRFPPPARRRVVGPPRGRGPARRPAGRRRGLVGGCHVMAASLGVWAPLPTHRKAVSGRRSPRGQRRGTGEPETTRPGLPSGLGGRPELLSHGRGGRLRAAARGAEDADRYVGAVKTWSPSEWGYWWCLLEEHA